MYSWPSPPVSAFNVTAAFETAQAGLSSFCRALTNADNISHAQSLINDKVMPVAANRLFQYGASIVMFTGYSQPTPQSSSSACKIYRVATGAAIALHLYNMVSQPDRYALFDVFMMIAHVRNYLDAVETEKSIHRNEWLKTNEKIGADYLELIQETSPERPCTKQEKLSDYKKIIEKRKDIENLQNHMANNQWLPSQILTDAANALNEHLGAWNSLENINDLKAAVAYEAIIQTYKDDAALKSSALEFKISCETYHCTPDVETYKAARDKYDAFCRAMSDEKKSSLIGGPQKNDPKLKALKYWKKDIRKEWKNVQKKQEEKLPKALTDKPYDASKVEFEDQPQPSLTSPYQHVSGGWNF